MVVVAPYGKALVTLYIMSLALNCSLIGPVEACVLSDSSSCQPPERIISWFGYQHLHAHSAPPLLVPEGGLGLLNDVTVQDFLLTSLFLKYCKC